MTDLVLAREAEDWTKINDHVGPLGRMSKKEDWRFHSLVSLDLEEAG